MSYQANRKPVTKGRLPPSRLPSVPQRQRNSPTQTNYPRQRISPLSETSQVAKKRKIDNELKDSESDWQESKIQVVVRCRLAIFLSFLSNKDSRFFRLGSSGLVYLERSRSRVFRLVLDLRTPIFLLLT